MIDCKDPLVSVVVCNFNYDLYLAEAIYSVLNQSYKNLQVVIVDDGSIDQSRSIIESIVDHRILTVFQDNQGQAAAFNTGFARCKGDYVAFLDSDDYWYPNKIELSISWFEDDEVVLVQHNLEVVDRNSNKTGRTHPGMNSGKLDIQSSYFRQNHTSFFCPTSGLMCRKSALSKIYPISNEWKICADVAFTRPLLIFGTLVTLSEPLGAYRIHEKNRWMNGEAQSKRIQNNQMYCDYVNFWLDQLGKTQRLDFLKSELFLRLSEAEAKRSTLLGRLKSHIKLVIRKVLAIKLLLITLNMRSRQRTR